MRRVLITGALALSFISINAGADEFTGPGFLGPKGDGVYLGATVGYHHTQVNTRVTASGVTSTPTNDGMIGGAYLGYALGLSQRFILSLEINANLFSSQTLSKTIGTQTVTKASIVNNYGVDIMPGIAIGKRSQIYLSTGAESGRLVVETSSGSSAYKYDERLYGIDLGAGYAIRVAKRVSLRLAYQHVWYFEQSQPFNAISVTNHFKPRDNRFMAGVAYHFIA
ncbi:MAG: outer membrane beta-barrel protein [Gammaproteobacteria bacterium]|nr:outer membrane beta-barrel protein [Gammaproteobacteria bacterium]MCH9743918.1 outer membrane beta-barrel protein [Gammaproteobacteria bacterium]